MWQTDMNKYSSDMKEEIERILRSRFTRGDIQTATNELFDLFNVRLSLTDSEEEYESYFGWCDVEGCENEGANGGGCWRETGYWTVCSKHSSKYRAGEPQPQMKQTAIDREKRRGADVC
jgi:hypothetical protein